MRQPRQCGRADSTRPVILCFAGDVWDGNPHSRHHLMRRFTARWDVLFIEGVPMRSFARADRAELGRVMAKLRARVGLRTVTDGLHVLRPLPVPPAGAAGRRAQLTALRLQILRARRRLGLRGPALSWFSLPVVAPLRGRLGEQGSLFYYQDRYDAFSHVDGERLRSHVAALARGCDACVASSEPLAADLRELDAQPVVVPHGVDADRFAAPTEVPADLARLEQPLVGCVGLVDDHLDFDAILAVARCLKRGTVVLVGAVNSGAGRLSHPRVALIGHRPYEQMPAYLNAFSCCLVPFAVNRLTYGVNPIKLREYLAAGRPTVATSLPEVEPYGDVVELARSPEDFATLTRQLLEGEPDSEELRARRRLRVAGESWDLAAQRIEGMMLELLKPGPGGRL